MHVLIAIIVFMSLAGAGVLGALWRLGGQLARQADRVGVGALRGGMVLQRFRIPILLWATLLAAIALLFAIGWRDRASVLTALAAGAALAAATIALAPKYTPVALRAIGRRVKQAAAARLKRRSR